MSEPTARLRTYGMTIEEAVHNLRQWAAIGVTTEEATGVGRRKSGKFIVEWAQEGDSTSIRISQDGTPAKDLPRPVKEMIADALLRDLSSAGELHIHVG